VRDPIDLCGIMSVDGILLTQCRVLNDCMRLGICGMYPGHTKPQVEGEHTMRKDKFVSVRGDSNTN